MAKQQLSDLEERIIGCRMCPRLVAWREEVAVKKRRAFADWDYWGKPVPGWGDPNGRLLVVGLAPGAHGANRTGRIFTGDDSGKFLFRALHRAGFANQPTSDYAGDGLELTDVFITAVCHCVPPDNKPTGVELETCQVYLREYISRLRQVQGVVALGRIAFDRILTTYRSLGYTVPPLQFGHALYQSMGPDLPWLITSYHPSRQNTQTGRLTEAMFDQVWELAKEKLK